MRSWLESLRGRLIASMGLVFLLGLGGALALRPLDEHRSPSVHAFVLLQEPYQDLSVLLPFCIAAVALIWIVSGWSLRHLSSASREAALVAPSNPGVRISTHRLPGEVRPLVDAVNGALDRLAEAYAAEQHFVADAAHELRTPLAVLGLRLQRAKLDGELDWAAIERDLGQVNRLVGQLLDLARKEHAREAGEVAICPVVNLSRIAREAAAGFVPLAEQVGRIVDVELPASLLVQGRTDDLRDLLCNLLDNSLVHGCGAIRLVGRVGVKSSGRLEAWITVSDEGPGVPAELQAAVFDRFRKADSTSSGHGLGLAIAREVARGHGGSVDLLAGPGCTLRVALPMAGSPQ